MAKYQAYAEYKDSGVEWLEEVPREWDIIKIKHLSTVKRGASPRPIDDPKYFDDNGEYAWVRIADVSASDMYLLNTTQTMSDLGSSLSVKLEPNQLFLSIAGTVGKPCINKIKACIHDGFVYFPELKIPNKYLFYVFAGEQAYKGLGKMGTQLNLNTDTVGDIKVALPKSQSDIYKIIEFLDHETTKIDHLIEKQQQLIELLKEKRQAVISHAVTKGLDPNVLMKDSGVEWLGKVPEHWAVSKLSYVAHGFNGDRGSNYPSGQDFVDEGIPFISSSELIHSKVDPVYASKITKEKYNSLGGLKIKVGDIIYCLRGSVGKNGLCEFNEGTIASSLMGIRCFSLSPYYLLLLLNSTVEFQQRSNFTTGSVSANLSAENVMSYKFALPPIKEQIEIANNLKKVFEKYDKLILKAESAIQLMQERRTALISAAVTGKIDVRNWQAPTVGAHTELSA
ncbi:restriction endonuclease subunit S [Acinetobacter nematophilus]|uniref:Type I restriction modification DNA specificity domain protein n=2 Tax=Acinetobacter baumannii TaxID=470 RepID=A0A009ILR2_ACIB9|nr:MULTISPECIES: restriction endonuclease subunit S [Acinetobacter calcoaceticus/baumannii complex]EKV2265218.1 restriction endonuclease subunit S [Acinetobacter baumannii]EKW2154730.1 restriction endonuclease subunit S [Acinetobacter baumannii]EXB05634.1 type I restriction modification DNA specificity domain protein [Acinetobacter baumannii 1295743]KCX96452.1 type I restriction modification DNA specificity domain protein [Acinetobacter sp. 72431]KRJ35154.1 restriction endonuclease subunit S [